MRLIIFVAFSACLLLFANLFTQAQQLVVYKGDMPNLVVFPQRMDKYHVIDSALFAITYEVGIINDTTNQNNTQKDIQILQIGKYISKSFSKLLFKADSLNTAAIKSGAESAPLFQEIVPPIEVYKNYPENKITNTYRTFAQGPIYLYEEDKIKFDWKILPDKKKYLTYTCQKATTTFRGRTYEAWFSTDIPISEGPYKFTGLPGLILEIQDTKGQYVYKCIGIQKLKTKLPIKMWSWQYVSTTREKLNASLIRMYKSPIGFLNSIGIQIMKMNENRMLEPGDLNYSCPYNPIELE